MIKTLITRKGFMDVEQPLFEVDVSLELFKRREEEVRNLIEQYYFLPIDTKILTEIKYKVEKLLWKEILVCQRKQKLKKLNEFKR
jgi:hypothetical protein